MRLLACLVILFVAATVANSTPVQINGSGPDYIGFRADLYMYDEFVTHTYSLLDTQTVNADGSFNLKADIQNTQLAFIRIHGVNGKLYLQPGSTYNLEFPNDVSNNSKVIHNRGRVEITFNELNETDINALVIDFNARSEAFFVDNYKKIAAFKRSGQVGYKQSLGLVDTTKSKKNTPEKIKEPFSFHDLIDNFWVESNERYAEANNDYFKTYVEYAFAAMKTPVVMSKRVSFQKFIEDRPFLFNHTEYMGYLSEFFEGYFIQRVQDDGSGRLHSMIAAGQNFVGIANIFHKDDFLKNREIAEYVVLRGLFDGFYAQQFNREAIITLIGAAAGATEYPNTRKLAQNMYTIVTRLREGYPAFNFALKNKEGELVKLEDFKGKYIYLGFYASWNSSCVAEMKTFPEFKKKYGKDIEFVSVSLDPDHNDMVGFLENHPDYDWTFLHHNAQPQLQDQYDIQSVPSFVFIDPEGTILSARELKPSETVEKKFFDLKQKLHPRKKDRVWDYKE